MMFLVCTSRLVSHNTKKKQYMQLCMCILMTMLPLPSGIYKHGSSKVCKRCKLSFHYDYCLVRERFKENQWSQDRIISAKILKNQPDENFSACYAIKGNRDGPIPIGAITSDNWKYRYWYIISCSKLSNSTTHDHICHFASRADGNAVNHKL